MAGAAAAASSVMIATRRNNHRRKKVCQSDDRHSRLLEPPKEVTRSAKEIINNQPYNLPKPEFTVSMDGYRFPGRQQIGILLTDKRYISFNANQLLNPTSKSSLHSSNDTNDSEAKTRHSLISFCQGYVHYRKALGFIRRQKIDGIIDTPLLEKVAKELKLALSYRPENGLFHETLGRILIVEGKIEEGISQLELASNHGSEKASVLKELIEEMKQTQQLNTEAAEIIRFLRNGDIPAAKKIVEKWKSHLLKADKNKSFTPDLDWAFSMLGNAYGAKGEYEAADQMFAQAGRFSADDRMNLALGYSHEGDIDSLKKAFSCVPPEKHSSILTLTQANIMSQLAKATKNTDPKLSSHLDQCLRTRTIFCGFDSPSLWC